LIFGGRVEVKCDRRAAAEEEEEEEEGGGEFSV